MTTNLHTWQSDGVGGHARFCVYPAAHAPSTYCAADPAEPQTLNGEASRAWHLDHPVHHPDEAAIIAEVHGVGTLYTIAYAPDEQSHFAYDVFVTSGPAEQYVGGYSTFANAMDTVRDEIVAELADNEDEPFNGGVPAWKHP